MRRFFFSAGFVSGLVLGLCWVCAGLNARLNPRRCWAVLGVLGMTANK